ncbi:MAG TPA: hypothetical protein VGC77_21805 [Rhodopseudomonas sp.]|uniref:hypothetical protein n=1 Tax=Rhodopseudomonas sp. TaxID=1078 RepID=UPI002EDB87E7
MTRINQHSLLLAIGLGAVALPAAAQAQWWSRAPADFEDCAERAENTGASKEARAELITQCDAKFAGRRKPGGGYTYYDFMQDKHFDIAGPNPTAEEQRQFDQHYTAFLDEQRRSIIAAAFAQKQRELTEAKPGGPPPAPSAPSLKAQGDKAATASAKPASDRAKPVPRLAASRAAPASRARPNACQDDALSCGWSRLATGVSSLKKSLFGAPPNKTKRS